MSTASQLLGLNPVPIGGLVPVSGAVVTTGTNYLPADGSDITASSYPLIAGNLPASLSAAIQGLPGTNTLYAVTYGAGIWVATIGTTVATSLLVSTDGGHSWLYKPFLAPYGFVRGLIYANSKFVMCGLDSGALNFQPYTSTDGITWTKQAYVTVSTGDGVQPGIMSYVNGYFIVPVFRSSLSSYTVNWVIYSTDGVTWTQSGAFGSYSYGAATQVAYGASLYVVVTNDGYTLSSPNMTTWTVRTNTGTGGAGWSSVVFANGCFVSAQGGTNVGTSFGYSTDGITWTQKTVPSGRYRRVIYAAGLFVAIGYNVCVTSPDGITWTARTIATGNWFDIAYNATDGFVVISETSSNITQLSNDGITWTTGNMGGPTIQKSICYGTAQGYMLAPYAGSSPIYTSTDGLNWTKRATLSPIEASVAACKPDGSIYVISNCASTYTTTDFTTWTSRTISLISASTPFSTRLRWVNDRFIISNTYGATHVSYYSYDGITWNIEIPSATGNTFYMSGFAYGNGVTVASCWYGQNTYFPSVAVETRYSFFSTSQGVWFYSTNLPEAVWSDVAFGNGVFVMVSKTISATMGGYVYVTGAPGGGYSSDYDTPNVSGRMCAISKNGIDWSISYLPIVGDWNSIIFNGHVFIAVNGSNTSVYAYSKDGYNWNMKDLGGFGVWNSICTGPSNKALAVNQAYPYTTALISESSTQVTLPLAKPYDGVNYVVRVK